VMVSATQMRIRRAIPAISLPLPALDESATLSHGVPQTETPMCCQAVNRSIGSRLKTSRAM